MLSVDNKYYIYVYLDGRKPGHFIYGNYSFNYEPFYVGKGARYRFRAHLKEAEKLLNKNPTSFKIRKIHKIWESGNKLFIVKVKSNISNIEAISLEKEVIKAIGRRDIKSGPLVNMTDGGDGLKNISAVLRSKMSRSRKKFIKAHPECLEMHSARMKGRPSPNKGVPSLYRGVPRKKETCDKISRKLKGKKNRKGKTKYTSEEIEFVVSLRRKGYSYKQLSGMTGYPIGVFYYILGKLYGKKISIKNTDIKINNDKVRHKNHSEFMKAHPPSVAKFSECFCDKVMSLRNAGYTYRDICNITGIKFSSCAYILGGKKQNVRNK